MVEPTDCGEADQVEGGLREALDGRRQTLERQTTVLTKLAAAAAG